MKPSRQDRLVNGTLYTLVTLFLLAVLYPFYYVLINSLNVYLDFGPAYWFPKEMSLFYYRLIFLDDSLSVAFLVSVLRTAGGILFALASASMAAYALRKPDLKFRNGYLGLATVTLFFSGGLIPMYLVIKNLMLYDTFLVYLMPAMFNFFYIIILMSVFKEIPGEMEDSASIDGAGSFTIFLKIFLPLSVPVIATISLFEGVSQWNSWFDTLYFTSGSNLMTLTGILIRIVNDSEINQMLYRMSSADSGAVQLNVQGIKFATMIISIVPILSIYPFVQKYFVTGIKIGAIKG